MSADTENLRLALDAAIGLTTLLMRTAESLQQVNTMIAAAQTEGRDLSDAEIQTIQAARAAAMARLNDLVAEG